MTMTESKSAPFARADLWLAALTGLCALALYVRTLAPSLLWGDSAEFQTLSSTLGMTHPTGYVTFILIGKVFTFIPFGNIAWRVNLMSAFFGALAVAQVYLIVRLLGGRRAAALSASLLLALTEGFWWRAIIAEIYTAAASMIASVWLLVLLWNRTGNWKYLFVAGLLGGLSLGIHSTISMTAVAVFVYLAITARKRSAWIGAGTGAILGVALTVAAFLYVDYNDPPSSVYNTVYRPSLSALGLTERQFDTPFERLLVIFPARDFWKYYFTASPETMRDHLAAYASLFPAWTLALIVIGAFAVFFRSRWYDGLYPLLGFLLIWGFAVTVSFSNYADYYVPSAVFVSAWMGVGASALLEGLDRLTNRNRAWGGKMRTVLLGAFGLGLVILPVWNARAEVRLAVEKGYTDFVRINHLYPIFAPDKSIQDARKILNRVDENAIVFADWDKLYSLVYTAQFEAGRADVTFHEAYITEEQRVAESAFAYIDANIDSRPIYFIVLLPKLSENYQVEDLGGSLYRLRRK